MIPIRKVKAKRILAGLLKELLLTCFVFFPFLYGWGLLLVLVI